MKDDQHYQSLGKCKLKPQWDTNSHPLRAIIKIKTTETWK